MFILALMMGNLWFAGSDTRAQTSIVAGELTALRKTTVNGEIASAGLTIGHQTQIKIAAQGQAFVNFGRLGHLELEANTNFTVSCSPDTLGGDLQTGQVVVNAPANVIVAISLPNCRVVSEGKPSSAVRVATINGRSTVTSYQGKFKILGGEQTHSIAAGEETWIDPEGHLLPGTFGQTSADSIPPTQLAASSQTSTLLNLLSASISYSVQQLIDSFRSPSFPFETTITCWDKNNLRCRPTGGMTP